MQGMIDNACHPYKNVYYYISTEMCWNSKLFYIVKWMNIQCYMLVARCWGKCNKTRKGRILSEREKQNEAISLVRGSGGKQSRGRAGTKKLLRHVQGSLHLRKPVLRLCLCPYVDVCTRILKLKCVGLHVCI